MSNQTSEKCPCGSGHAYPVCCQPLHQGHRHAADARQLMCSRYCAYVLGLEDYLLRTWHPQTRPEKLNLQRDTPDQWIGLKVLAYHYDSSQPDQATVEFIAKYKVNGRAHRLQENSRFVHEQGRWFYLAGDIKPE